MIKEFRKPLADLRFIRERKESESQAKMLNLGVASEIISECKDEVETRLMNPDHPRKEEGELLKVYEQLERYELTFGLETPGSIEELGKLYSIAEMSSKNKRFRLAGQSLEKAVSIIGGERKKIDSLRSDAQGLSEDPEHSEGYQEKYDHLVESIERDSAANEEWSERFKVLQNEIGNKRLKRLRAKHGTGAKIIATAAGISFLLGVELTYITKGDIRSYFYRPAVVTAGVNPVEYEPTAIIVNGIGAMDNSTSKTQRKSLENAFAAYDLFKNQKGVRTELFVSNPYGFPVPNNVKIKEDAKTENVLSAIKNARGKVYLVFFSAQRPYDVGLTPEQMDPSIYLSDGSISPMDMESALLSNRSQKVLISNITNPKFTNNIDSWQSPNIGTFNVARPIELTGIMVRDDVNFSDVAKRFYANKNQSIEELFKPYFAGGSYVNQGDQQVNILQSPAYRGQLFPQSGNPQALKK